MIESTGACTARHFTEFLAKVDQGEAIRIRDGGRMVARFIPDYDFKPGAALFRDQRTSSEAADAIAHELKQIN